MSLIRNMALLPAGCCAQVSPEESVKYTGQPKQLYFWCALRLSIRVNVFWQLSQTNFLVLRWTPATCLWRANLSRKMCPQVSQENPLPVWMRWWRSIPVIDVNVLLQNPQGCIVPALPGNWRGWTSGCVLPAAMPTRCNLQRYKCSVLQPSPYSWTKLTHTANFV